ncbi:MAG: hypothetical protein R2882_01935 [Gemmatimonadales bacterium]
MGLPVGLLNVSPRSIHAPAALAEILRTMATQVVPDASITLPLGSAREAAQLVHQPEAARALGRVLTALMQAVASRRSI